MANKNKELTMISVRLPVSTKKKLADISQGFNPPTSISGVVKWFVENYESIRKNILLEQLNKLNDVNKKRK